MKLHKSNNTPVIGLFSAPWPIYNRPSIQLGILKGWLKKRVPELRVETYPLYLKIAEQIGYSCYHDISEKSWLAESIYAAILYKSRTKQIETLFNKILKQRKIQLDEDFRGIVGKVKKKSDEIIKGIDWGKFNFIGFSVSICQLTSSQYFIREINRKNPHLFVVAGGSIISGHGEADLKRIFPGVDLFIKGEGEIPLENFVYERKLSRRRISKVADNKNLPTGFCQIKSLDALPSPEYDDYFGFVAELAPSKRFFPNLPVEISRGCWWSNNKSKSKKGCAFCNLNFQWDGFRSKTPEKFSSEINILSDIYKTVAFSFMDNVLPAIKMKSYFTEIQKLDKQFNLFCEVRATTTSNTLDEMKNAGVNNVQIGIEALSTSLLKKLKKGTTAIQNLEIMKNCEELGIKNGANLMIHFPGSNKTDVEDTLRTMAFATPFRPLNVVEFQLGRGSYVYENPEQYGLQSIFNHPNYSVLFPEKIFTSVDFIQKAYRGDLTYQRKIWKTVKKKLEHWKKFYNDLHQSPGSGPILEYMDGKNFLIIRYRMPDGQTLTHRLEGTSRKIYLYCRHHRSIKKISRNFDGLAESKLAPFLKMLVNKKLMFSEDDKYLSLAVKKRR